MASYQQFYIDDISVKYYQQPNVILIQPGQETSKEKFHLLKNKIETILNVNSMKTEPAGGISLKLDQNSAMHVAELLRAFNAKGGEEIEDAQDLSQDSAEEDAKDMEAQTGQPAPQPNQMQQGQMPMAAAKRPSIFSMIYESAFGQTKTFNQAKKPGRRTGKYWKPIEAVTGKNRSKIQKEDVLSVRKDYARKPANEKRNKVLRSLDKAFDYFFNRLEDDLGRQAAERYADDYYGIDDLNPKDYALVRPAPEPIAPEEEATLVPPEQVGMNSDEMNGPDFSEFIDGLSDSEEEDSYDDIEIEEETY